eukprot:1397861-Alexandrium_andersonii.AAC.1
MAPVPLGRLPPPGPRPACACGAPEAPFVVVRGAVAPLGEYGGQGGDSSPRARRKATKLFHTGRSPATHRHGRGNNAG